MLFTEANIKKYNLVITKSGNFYDATTKRLYYYHYVCEGCGYPYLGHKINKFCGRRCATIGENNYWFGKTGHAKDKKFTLLCIPCDKHAHSLPGCGYGEIRKKVKKLRECKK